MLTRARSAAMSSASRRSGASAAIVTEIHTRRPRPRGLRSRIAKPSVADGVNCFPACGEGAEGCARLAGLPGSIERQSARMMQTTARISVDHPEEKIAMAKLIFAVLTLVAAVLMQPRSGGAAPYWPWCSQYDQPSYAHSCAFSSYEQCFQTVWGIGG